MCEGVSPPTRPGTASTSITEGGARAVHTSTDVTSVTRTTACPTAASLSPLQVEKGATERGPNRPVRSEKLSLYLDGYDPEKASYLTKGFSEGFRIESEGLEGECLRVDNPRLPVHLRPVLQKKLQKELDAGRILGPFDEPPFPNLRVSPIKVAPKKTPGEYRFIHNLEHIHTTI